jgi:hypothetical protein
MPGFNYPPVLIANSASRPYEHARRAEDWQRVDFSGLLSLTDVDTLREVLGA